MKLKSLIPAAVICSTFFSLSLNAQESKPNIIFIMADDLGYGELTCYNKNAIVKTPNIDRLAQNGIRMTQAYASPVCSPTRTCLLTGKFPQKSGVYGNFEGAIPGIGPSRKSFAEDIKIEGYKTAWFGKWHQGWDVSNHPLNNGFDLAYGFLGGMHDYWDVSNGDHYIGGPFAPNAFVFDGFRVAKSMRYFTEEITERAVKLIKEKSSVPFFMYLAYNAPHTPFQAPDKAILKYLKAGCDTLEAVRSAMIDVLDQNIGRVLDELVKNGKDKNTLVVFMSDNGSEKEKYNGGLRGTKMTAWEGGIRVPMIACFPNTISGSKTSDAICSITDMAATFINLANPKVSDYGDGKSLIPWWTDKKKGNVHDSLVFSISINGGAGTLPTVGNLELLGVRMGDWKLVKDSKRNIDALYNLIDDPQERNDLSQKNTTKKSELLQYASSFLSGCPADCGRLAAKDTRPDGDKIRNEALKKHLRSIK